jgi:putative glycerol-1-phosphate prenyltransferase
MTVFSHLNSVIDDKGAAYVVLIDPDRKNDDSLESRVDSANESCVDALFVGGSLMMDGNCEKRVKRIKDVSTIPVIFFPGGVGQLNSHYDAMLFMSIISGRNPHYLIGEQAIAAPMVKDLGVETIPTGYMLMDGGTGSTVEFMSGTKPIPMNRSDIAVAHALAGQYLGMKLIYLEAGSGAKEPVATHVVEAVTDALDISVIVGGGIRNPETASAKVKAGASIVVTGTVIEENSNLMSELADAVHWKV